MLRGSGICWDLRKIYNYGYAYFNLNFSIPIGINGDCYDQFFN